MFSGLQPLLSKVCAVGTIIFRQSAVQVLNTEAGILRVAVRLELLYSPALFLRDITKFKVCRPMSCLKGQLHFL